MLVERGGVKAKKQGEKQGAEDKMIGKFYTMTAWSKATQKSSETIFCMVHHLPRATLVVWVARRLFNWIARRWANWVARRWVLGSRDAARKFSEGIFGNFERASVILKIIFGNSENQKKRYELRFRSAKGKGR